MTPPCKQSTIHFYGQFAHVKKIKITHSTHLLIQAHEQDLPKNIRISLDSSCLLIHKEKITLMEIYNN